MFVHTGDYVEHTSDGITRSTYYTFTPRPLMTGDFFTMGDDLVALLSTTHRALGILEGMTFAMPDKEIFADLTLLKESCFSKMIDYPDLDIRSVLINRSLSKPDTEINNIMSAYRHVLEKRNPKTNYNEIAQCALHGNDSEQKIRTRAKPMFLTNTISNYRQYNPAAPESIHSALNDITKYVESDAADILIKAAMHHYQFEMIHPYDCYNGIIGRILINKMLYNVGLGGIRYLSLSECLYHHKLEYFEKLGQTQKHGSYTIWIEFFIRMIGEAAQSGIEFTKKYISITRCDEEKLATRSDRMHHTADVYRYFKKNIVSSIGQVCEQLQLSFNAVSRAIDVLQTLGILTQITSASRNRLFAHAGLMELVLTE